MSVAVDVTCISCWARRLRRVPQLINTAFVDEEVEWARGDIARLAMAWTVKESVLKLLGCGFDEVGWKGVGLVGSSEGELAVRLSPEVRQRCERTSMFPAAAVTCTSSSLVATTLMHFTDTVSLGVTHYPTHSRAARSRTASAAARQAGQRAAQLLGAGPIRFVPSRQAAPQPLGLAGRRPVDASFTHDCGVALAAVTPTNESGKCDIGIKLSDTVSISKFDLPFPCHSDTWIVRKSDRPSIQKPSIQR